MPLNPDEPDDEGQAVELIPPHRWHWSVLPIVGLGFVGDLAGSVSNAADNLIHALGMHLAHVRQEEEHDRQVPYIRIVEE